MSAPFPHPHLLGIEGLSAADISLILDEAEPWLEFNRGARKADKRLRDAISEVSQEMVVAPIQAELVSYGEVRDGLAAALR